MFNQPKTLWTLVFGNLWETFSYYGTLTILTLYFIHVFHLSRSASYALYGAYAAFAYALPILGGIIADRWLGGKKTMIIGSLINVGGNLLLISSHYSIFCFGLAASLIGSGLFKSNASHLVGTLYQDGDAKKEMGFTWSYLAVNVGGTLGPLVYGMIVYSIGWNYAFLCSALGILSAALWFLANWRAYENKKVLISLKPINLGLIGFGLLIVCLGISSLFYWPFMINFTIFAVFLAALAYVIREIKKHSGSDRRRLLALFILSFFGMFYFAAGLQVGTTITLFIQQKIYAGVINTQLPASTFSTLYPLFVLLLAPAATYLWRTLRAKGISIAAPTKLALGILLAAIGMGVFALAALTNLVISGIVLGNLFLSAGELVLTPAIYTAISNLSPTGMKSTMMGCWLLFIALGGYLSSVLAQVSHGIDAHVVSFTRSIYADEFAFIAVFTFIVAIVMRFFLPRLRKMII